MLNSVLGISIAKTKESWCTLSFSEVTSKTTSFSHWVTPAQHHECIWVKTALHIFLPVIQQHNKEGQETWHTQVRVTLSHNTLLQPSSSPAWPRPQPMCPRRILLCSSSRSARTTTNSWLLKQDAADLPSCKMMTEHLPWVRAAPALRPRSHRQAWSQVATGGPT